MKKYIFLAFAIVAFGSFSNGQVKIMQQFDTARVNDDTVVVRGSSSTAELSVNLFLVNLGPTISFYGRRDSLRLPLADTDNTFCWGGYCWSQTTNVSPAPQSIGSGDTAKGANEFSSHYFPDGYCTPAFMRYAFVNSNVSTDSIWVVIEYIPCATGIQNIAIQNTIFSAPYPNPANNSVNFDYTLANNTQSADLKIFNLLGECIQTLPLNTARDKATINTQTLPSGIYVCEIEASGSQPAYQKLIVTH